MVATASGRKHSYPGIRSREGSVAMVANERAALVNASLLQSHVA